MNAEEQTVRQLRPPLNDRLINYSNTVERQFPGITDQIYALMRRSISNPLSREEIAQITGQSLRSFQEQTQSFFQVLNTSALEKDVMTGIPDENSPLWWGFNALRLVVAQQFTDLNDLSSRLRAGSSTIRGKTVIDLQAEIDALRTRMARWMILTLVKNREAVAAADSAAPTDPELVTKFLDSIRDSPGLDQETYKSIEASKTALSQKINTAITNPSPALPVPSKAIPAQTKTVQVAAKTPAAPVLAPPVTQPTAGQGIAGEILGEPGEGTDLTEEESEPPEPEEEEGEEEEGEEMKDVVHPPGQEPMSGVTVETPAGRNVAGRAAKFISVHSVVQKWLNTTKNADWIDVCGVPDVFATVCDEMFGGDDLTDTTVEGSVETLRRKMKTADVRKPGGIPVAFLAILRASCPQSLCKDLKVESQVAMGATLARWYGARKMKPSADFAFTGNPKKTCCLLEVSAGISWIVLTNLGFTDAKSFLDLRNGNERLTRWVSDVRDYADIISMVCDRTFDTFLDNLLSEAQKRNDRDLERETQRTRSSLRRK